MTITQLGKEVRATLDRIREIDEEARALATQRTEQNIHLGELRQLCTHPPKERCNRAGEDDSCGVCWIDWNSIPRSD